jgi:hypothetical protein
MSRASMLHTDNATHFDDSEPMEPNSTSTMEPPAPSVEDLVNPVTSNTFEDFLMDVEHCVRDAGQLLLFSGEHLRLEVMLLRHEKNSRVIWGLKRHEDWAFKATLLRFARGRDPVHLVLSTEHEGGYRLRGWVVKRSRESFWASPLPAEQANSFWERCLNPFSLEKLKASYASDRAESSPQPESPTESCPLQRK